MARCPRNAVKRPKHVRGSSGSVYVYPAGVIVHSGNGGGGGGTAGSGTGGGSGSAPSRSSGNNASSPSPSPSWSLCTLLSMLCPSSEHKSRAATIRSDPSVPALSPSSSLQESCSSGAPVTSWTQQVRDASNKVTECAHAKELCFGILCVAEQLHKCLEKSRFQNLLEASATLFKCAPIWAGAMFRCTGGMSRRALEKCCERFR